jgi:ABC-type amino acid transport substrate-binding protein/CheY-like chemotaxis protein/two-component sensor histidine kinase
MLMNGIDQTKRSFTKAVTTGILVILASLAVIAAPSPALAETKAVAGSEGSKGAGTSGDADTLTFLTNVGLPFAALKDGKPVGFAVEILHEIMQRLGRADTIEFDEWSVAVKRTLTQPGTVLMPPSRTPEREDLFKWVGPLVPEKVVLFARRDSDLVINSFEDAKNVGGIATVKGYASENLLKQKGFTNLVSQRSPIQGPDALKFGRVDLWLNSNITMKQLAFEANVDPELLKPVFVVMEVPSYLAFSKSVSDEVVNRWQVALDDMKRDGSWARIISNWIPAELLRIGEGALDLSEKEKLWIEANPTVKVVQFFQEPPFTLNQGDLHTGYLYDLLLETLRTAGLKPEFVGGFSSYDSMVDALQNGTVDILTTMENTRRLPDDIVRTVPVVKTPYALVAKNSAPGITKTSDLFGKKVAVVKGYAQDQHLDRFPRIEKVHISNNDEGFTAVRMGRAKYFLNNLANAAYVIKKTFATDLRIAGTLSYGDFPPLTLSFGIYDKDSELPGIINKALAAVPIHTLSELRDKWLAEEFSAMDTVRINLTPEEQAFLETHPVIRVHNEQSWAPFNFYEHGSPTGFSIDYMDLLAEKIGLQVEYTSGPAWNEFIAMIKERRLDVMLNIVKTSEREKFIRFTTQPYIETPRAIVVRKDDSTVRNFSDLYGRTVVVEKGFFYENYLKQNHPEINIMTVKDTAETLRVVANGDADATLGVIAVEQFLINKHFFSNLKLIVDPEEKALRSFDQFIGVRSDWPLLATMLDKAMGAVTDKELVTLSRKWIVQEDGDGERVHLSPEENTYLRDHPILNVAFDVDWPPVEFSDGDIGMNGMAADYLNKMSELLGVEFESGRPRPWKEMMEAVENGELDFLSAISPTSQRRKWMDFTDSYLSFPIVIFTDKEVPYIGSISDLKSKPVAVVDGYASHDLLLENHPELTLLPVRDVKEGLMSVSTGKAFAFVGSLATVSHVMSREGLTNLKVSGETPYSFDIAMGARKDNTVLLNILDKALAAISPQERSAINRRWTSVTFEYATDYSLMWKILGGALVLVVIVLYWNNRLKIEITERKRAEKAAEAANQAKSEFLANMSHELRTPLNAILGFAQIMERNTDLSSEKESLKIIQRSGTHLLTLINQVLDLSKIEAGHITTEEQGFDLLHLLDELENMLSLKTDKQHLALEFDCTKEVPRHIRTDEVKLRQVLINLLSNAIKFTDEGSVKLRVSLKGHRDPESTRLRYVDPVTSTRQTEGSCAIQFEIEDTGPGIAPEEMDHLFEAFGQTASGREAREGTGLGLLISHKFVQLMGGDMYVTSEVGQGTTFGFDIRAQVMDEADMIPESPTRHAIALEPGQPSYRILIVDDNPDNRQLLIKLLDPFGFDLREAGNGQEAIEIWELWQPHLIWMDMRMPVMDGYEATKIIRAQDSAISDAAIIAVTASVFEDQRVAVMSIGCDDIIIKPFKENEIIEMLKKHIDVKFVYASDEIPGEKADLGKDRLNLIPSDLSDLPDETVMKLMKSVAALEMDTTLNVIEEIREHDEPLADALKKLVEGYRFDKLQKLLDEA